MHNSEYTKTHWIAYFDVVNFMVCELYIDFFFLKIKSRSKFDEKQTKLVFLAPLFT